jgi:hypothetical protein
MRKIIPVDFHVEEFLHDGLNKTTFYYKAEDKCSILEHHFVWLNEGAGFNEIGQSKILRYEIAKYRCEFEASGKETDGYALSNGDRLEFVNEFGNICIGLYFSDSNTCFCYDPEIEDCQDEMFKTLSKDALELKKIKIHISEKKRADIFHNDTLNEKLDTYSPIDFEVMMFEQRIAEIENIVLPSCSLTKCFEKNLNELTDLGGLKVSLKENFESFNQTEERYSGSDSYFFDALKVTKKLFFDRDYSTEAGAIDEKRLNEDFEKIWEEFSFNQKLALKFLESEHQNNTLLNLYFFHPNFKLKEYQRLICMPYQPDSEDESWLRSVSTFASWIMR